MDYSASKVKIGIWRRKSIIGSVRATVKEETVLIGKLMVHPDFRRRGFGKKMLSEIERYFPDKRYGLIFLYLEKN